MKIDLYLLSFILLSQSANCVQPYFPSQIVFSPDNGQTIIAIDELNQQAYMRLSYGSSGQETSYVMKHFPYAIPDSPQSKYYVQLLIDSLPLGCSYGTYWKYGGNIYNSFPSHWLNGSSFEIKNYLQFKNQMLHVNTGYDAEDYWHANVTCFVDGGRSYPCEEIYFEKNSEMPLRSTRVVRRGWSIVQEIINYQIISMGKVDDKYFHSIPKNWSLSCRDVMLGLLYYPQTTKLQVNQSVEVQIWLITPPHRIDGNDTVVIQWKTAASTDALSWTPEELSFNSENFQEKQTLTITRLRNSSQTTLIPFFIGGGFDLVIPDLYPIYIQ